MITIQLTEEQAATLISELIDLSGYQWNDDKIHADNCGSKVISTIESQIEEQKVS